MSRSAQLTRRGAALRHLTAAGALDYLGPAAGCRAQICGGFLHLDAGCEYLEGDVVAPAPAELLAALDAGELVVCACTQGVPSRADTAALVTLAELVRDLDGLLFPALPGAGWEMQLLRHTQADLRYDEVVTLLAAQSLPDPVGRWAVDYAERCHSLLGVQAAQVRAVVLAELPGVLAASAAQVGSPEGRAERAAAVTARMLSGVHGEVVVGTPAGTALSSAGRGVALCYPSVLTGEAFYAVVPAWDFWSAVPGLVECGPALITDTPAVFAAALRLRAGVADGPVRGAREALAVARGLGPVGGGPTGGG